MEAKAFPMNGGDGAYSYTKNSYYQRAASYAVKEMLEEAITEKFDITSLSSSSNTIRIADLGCSVGPNTFITMQNLIESMERKCHSQDCTTMPEFHLFFNDHASNDFNTLFNSLPPDRHYFAAGVPGSFHGRLFPKSSLHFVHSSCALHWLSRVPEDLLDKSSPAWNKGRIHYTNSSEQVANAYANQFAKDMEVFLDARADEIAVGGMMVVIMPALPDGVRLTQDVICVFFDILEQSVVDMVKLNPTLAQIKKYDEDLAKKPKALTYIHAAVSKVIFTRIMACESPKEAWDKLKEEFEGSERVKLVKLLGLKREFEMLRQKESEKLKDYSSKLMEIVNQIRLFGEDFPDHRVVKNILVSLLGRFEPKISAN